MALILFLIRLRVEAFWQSEWLGKILTLFFMATALANGVFLGSGLNALLANDPEKGAQFILFFPDSIYLIISLLQGNFYLNDPIQRHHPLSSLRRFIINLFDEYIRLLPLTMGLLSVTILMVWNFTTIAFSIQVIFHWLFMVAFVRSLKQLLNLKPSQGLHFVVFINLMVASVALLFIKTTFIAPVYASLFAYVLLVWACYLYQVYSDEELRGVANFSFIKGIPAHLWSNKKVMLSLIAGILLKALILGIIANNYFKKGYLKPEFLFFVGLFASPTILFTYVFNNLWGFFPAQALSMQIATNRNHTFIRFYTQIFALPFLLDFTITAIFCFSIPSITTQGLVHYGSLAIVLLPLSWHFSLYLPKKIGSLWKNSTTTNPVGVFAALGIIFASWGCNFYYPAYQALYLVVIVPLSLWLGYTYLFKAKLKDVDFTTLQG